MELQGMKSQPLFSRVEIMGRLLSKEIVHKEGLDLNVGLYQHFELSANYRFWRKLYLTAGVDIYTRATEYSGMMLRVDNTEINQPAVQSKQLGLHLMLAYQW